MGLVGGEPVQRSPAPYSIHEKAYYADAATVEYVQPGLTITVNSAAVSANGTITVNLHADGSQRVASGHGRCHHSGAISLSYIAATIPNGQEDYTAYTTKRRHRNGNCFDPQPGADSGGTTTTR